MVLSKINAASYAYLVIILYIILGALYSVEFAKPITLVIFLILLLVNFLFIVRSFLFNTIKINNLSMVLIFFSSFFFMLISAIYNNSIELFLGALSFLFCFSFFSLNFMNKKVYEFFDLPIKLLFFVTTPLNLYFGVGIPFQGMFSNPNSLGGLYATISVISLGVFYDKFSDRKNTDWVLLAIMFFSCIFSLISNSRISFAISFLCFIFLIFLRFSGVFYLIKGVLYLNFFKIFKILAILAIIIIFIFFNFKYISDIFLYKLIYKMENDNFSAGRSSIWQLIIDNKLIWGHGRESLHLDNVGLAAHNTFMSILDQFGYISSAFLFLGCIFLIIYYSFPRVIKLYGILPLCVVLGFFLMSISESMINKTIMFSLLAVINLGSYTYLEKK